MPSGQIQFNFELLFTFTLFRIFRVFHLFVALAFDKTGAWRCTLCLVFLSLFSFQIRFEDVIIWNLVESKRDFEIPCFESCFRFELHIAHFNKHTALKVSSIYSYSVGKPLFDVQKKKSKKGIHSWLLTDNQQLLLIMMTIICPDELKFYLNFILTMSWIDCFWKFMFPFKWLHLCMILRPKGKRNEDLPIKYTYIEAGCSMLDLLFEIHVNQR